MSHLEVSQDSSIPESVEEQESPAISMPVTQSPRVQYHPPSFQFRPSLHSMVAPPAVIAESDEESDSSEDDVFDIRINIIIRLYLLVQFLFPELLKNGRLE